MCIESRHLRKDLFQHIEEDAFVHFDVFRLALEGLLTERLSVETHIVEVSPCIVDDVKAVGTGLVPRKAHAQAVAHVCEVFASRHGGKASDANLL